MSKENLIKLMQAAAEDEQLMQQLQSTSNYDEVKTLAREQGFDLGDLSTAEVKRTMGVVSGEISEELTDEELELVAGGFLKIPWTWQGSNKRVKGLTGEDIGA